LAELCGGRKSVESVYLNIDNTVSRSEKKQVSSGDGMPKYVMSGQPHSLQRNRCLPAATPLFTICPDPHFLHVGIFPSPSFQMGVFCRKYIFKLTLSLQFFCFFY
jgi:hypothetical protein